MTSRRKRAYKAVAVALSGERHAVLLDGKPARVGAAALQFPTAALADAVAQEWRDQGEQLDPACMPLTALATAALNRVASARGDVIQHILGYARNELLCYRAAEPPELAARQKAQWDALLEWVHERHAVRLVADAGISFIEQPVDALLRMQEIVSAFVDFELAALDAAARLTSSFVVTLALVERHISAEEAFAVSHLDELFQAEKWGCDAEAEPRRSRIIAELKAVEIFVALLSS
jgi:chaperone required for assembly of F1-ATPase